MPSRLAIILVLALTSAARTQNILSVPSAQYPTIQSAIIAAAPSGDGIAVAPGVYFENIDFLGKAVAVVGAGAGQSIIDGNLNGSTVTFASGEGPNSILDGFTIRRGTGTVVTTPLGGMSVYGGGIYITGVQPPTGSTPTISPTIRSCEITDNVAELGAGISASRWAAPLLQDLDVHANRGIDPLVLGTSYGAGVFGSVRSRLTLTRCKVRNNLASHGAGLFANDADVTARDCLFELNVAVDNGASQGGGVFLLAPSLGVHPSFENCVIQFNRSETSGGGLRYQGAAATNYRLKNCIIQGNMSNAGPGIFGSTGAFMSVINCTITRNIASTSNAAVELSQQNSATFTNSIIWGNFPASLILQPTATATASHCDIEGGFVGTNNFDSDPLFLDGPNGDFHLALGSPCAEMGDPTFGDLPATDFEGDPRSIYAAPDVGVDEITDIYLDPSVAGNVGVGQGGPFLLLFINSQTGGLTRRVNVGVSQNILTQMLPPATNPSPAGFAIFGIFEAPDYLGPVPLPFGIGTMSFVPCPLFPSLSPYIFTLTNNLASGPCGQLVASTPAPWSSGQQPGIPFPLRLTLQGIIEETPGVFRVTNAVVVVIS